MQSQLQRLNRFVCVASFFLVAAARPTEAPPRGYSIPLIDLAAETNRQCIVDREPGQYLGHPSTVLLEDGRTMLCVYPKGHGKGALVFKRSTDGGRTWSERLPVPASWATSKETPTIHRVVDAGGKKRLIVWSGLYPARLAVSEDEGTTWSEFKPAGDWGGIVVMGFVEPLKTGAGHYLAMFHDDGRYFTATPKPTKPTTMTLYTTFSTDGGLTWSFPKAVFASSEVHLCEPGVIRSPDGKQMAVLLRENRRVHNSHVIFSDDEGKTWTTPHELPGAFTGDRHTGKYAPDGRLFISFRDTTPKSPTKGDWAGWVGRYEDITQNRDGQYRVRLMKNHRAADCAYPGVEVLPDGTFVTTTYGHWRPGEQPYVASVRFNMKELDERAAKMQMRGTTLKSTNASLSNEEFVGPFSSWRDVRRDFGARGDGQADDTAALQQALDELTHHTNACVLYLPAGTYRLTDTVKTVRKAHTDCQGVAVVGEDPAYTILRWDGPSGRTMFQWDAWYSKISRLTFDGAGRAGTALLYGPAFSTYNETSDLLFRDATNGLVFGGPKTAGQAENAVLRCQFLRCEIGMQTVNWNSMDIWVWYGRFEDCARGVHNVMGNWHVWESLFLRSRLADLSSINLMAFSVVNNTSLGSRRFFDFSTGHTWGSPVSLTGNRVLEPTGDWAVILDNAGPYLVVDNQFRLAGASRGVRMTWADQTLVGNSYTKTNAVDARGRFRRVAEKVVSTGDIADTLPTLPSTPPRRERKVFEVPAGANADTIQWAIDEAAKLTSQRPVVHLPMGNYKVEKTLVIPSGSDLQFIGDSAGETGTRLNWSGPVEGVVLRVQGPSHATLRDFYIHAGQACALLVENCDQPGGRIFADQLNANGPGGKGKTNAAAVRVAGFENADVLLRALQGSGNGGRWVEVLGGPDAITTNQISIFTGATGSAAGQYDVRQGGRLVVRGVYHERSSDSLNGLQLTDRGTLSIDATRFSYATSPTAPTVAADNFRGLFTLATCMLLPVETKESCRFELRGDGSGGSVLALNNQFWIEKKTTADDVWRNLAQPPARGGLIGCNINTSKKEAAPKGFDFLANIGDHPDPAKSASGAGPLENRGTVDDATLLRHLAPLRAARVWLPDSSVPMNVTDLRIHRVMAGGGTSATVEFNAGRGQ